MALTGMEAKVVEHLRRQRVADMAAVRQAVGVSHMTVVRALNKVGYWSSINHNSRYYTLADVPRFDGDGLWLHRGVCFSKHRTLDETLVALVERAPAGMTVAELEERVHTKVGNLLSRLRSTRRVSLYRAGRPAVYLSVDEQRQREQLQERQRRREAMAASSRPAERPPYPPGTDVVLVLQVLTEIIRAPKADAAALAKAVRSRGGKVTTAGVQRVLDFYSLKKKRNTGRS
jgi:hypothetical protein